MKDNYLKIVSDGTPAGTQVIDSNGDRIGGIQSIEWNADLGDSTCWAIIEFKNIPIEAGGVRRYS